MPNLKLIHSCNSDSSERCSSPVFPRPCLEKIPGVFRLYRLGELSFEKVWQSYQSGKKLLRSICFFFILDLCEIFRPYCRIDTVAKPLWWRPDGNNATRTGELAMSSRSRQCYTDLGWKDEMVNSGVPNSKDVEQLMLNAQLRSELEPFVDESFDLLDWQRMTTAYENEYLASMLAWERAPVLPVSKWFQPELVIESPEDLDDAHLSERLNEVIARLYDGRIVLECTEHLSDRALYTLIFRDIRPSFEKKVEIPKNYLHWHCIDENEDEEAWLRFYATEDEREEWRLETGGQLPEAEIPPYPRKMPRRAK